MVGNIVLVEGFPVPFGTTEKPDWRFIKVISDYNETNPFKKLVLNKQMGTLDDKDVELIGECNSLGELITYESLDKFIL